MLNKQKNFTERMASCDQQNMFEHMIDNCEDKKQN